MDTLETIPKTYEDATLTLAEWHGDGVDQDVEIYAFDDPARAEVRLLEASDAFREGGAVNPFGMGRSQEFPFKSAVALVTKEELARVKQGQMSLPTGWELASMRQVWPRVAPGTTRP